MRASLLLFVLFLGCTGSILAQDSISDRVSSLGSLHYLQREKAMRALDHLGPAALPALQQGMLHPDREIRSRARALSQRIEERMLHDMLRRPTLTRFHFVNASIDQALWEIEAQTGLAFGPVRKTARMVSVDTGTVPFWNAWQQFCEAAGLEEVDLSRSAERLAPLMDESILNEWTERNWRSDLTPPYYKPAPLDLIGHFDALKYSVDTRSKARVRMRGLGITSLPTERRPHLILATELRLDPTLAVRQLPRVEITRLVDPDGKHLPVRIAKVMPDAFARGQHADLLSTWLHEIQRGGLLHLCAVDWPYDLRHLTQVHGNVRAEFVLRTPLIEIPNVFKAVGTDYQGKNGIHLQLLHAERSQDGTIVLRLRLSGLDCWQIETQQEDDLRSSLGLGYRHGGLALALGRIELLNVANQKFRLLKFQYQDVQRWSSYDVELRYAVNGRSTNDLRLVLKEPRHLCTSLPFVVCNVSWPSS